MKKTPKSDDGGADGRSRRRRRKHVAAVGERTDSRQVNDLLKTCLEKVIQLQEELRRDEHEGDDAEAAGYAACAVETLRFLENEGLSADHPVVRTLSERLFGNRE